MNRFPKAESFDLSIVREKIMGPNPLKFAEELLESHQIPEGGVVLDLGSGTGITSALLAREYGFTVYAADLWSAPGENMRFFESLGLTNKNVIPLRIDASAGLPFTDRFFDAVVSIDSYSYFGRDPRYLGEKLLPYVKPGGYLYLAIPGMHKDCHDDLPPELLTSWTPEQLDYMHDMEWWRALIGMAEGVEIADMHEMACHRQAWLDWVSCDNEYAAGDRQAWDAGAVEYLNSSAVTLRKLQ